MTNFDDALKVWAKKYLETEVAWKPSDIVEVVSVRVSFREGNGYCYTCWEDDKIDIEIVYKNHLGETEKYDSCEYDDVWISQFQLLQELFKETD